MNSELFICDGCGSKCQIRKERPCGHFYCHRCIITAYSRGQQVCTLKHTNVESDDSFDFSLVSAQQEEFCYFCNGVIESNDTTKHNDSCDMYPVNCNFCGKKFVRSSMKVHVQECPRNIQKCKFSPVGCLFQGTELDMEKHEGNKIHIGLVVNVLLELQKEQSNNASLIARSFNELMSMKDKVHSIQADLLSSMENNNSADLKKKMEEIIKKQEMEIKLCKQQMLDLEQKHNKIVQQNRKIEELMMQQNKKLEDLRLQKPQWEQVHAIGYEAQNEKIKKLEECQEKQNSTLKEMTKQIMDQNAKLVKNERNLTTLMVSNDSQPAKTCYPNYKPCEESEGKSLGESSTDHENPVAKLWRQRVKEKDSHPAPSVRDWRLTNRHHNPVSKDEANTKDANDGVNRAYLRSRLRQPV